MMNKLILSALLLAAPILAEEKAFRLIVVKHVYVGGIASLFKGNTGTISTEPFVSPAFGKQGQNSFPFNSNSGQQPTFRF
jgi:hypothetical protein